MKLVRDELGPDAVVLSTQQDNASGKIRITAALEETPLDELEFADGRESLRSIDDLSERLHYHRIPVGLTDRLLGAAGRLSNATRAKPPWPAPSTRPLRSVCRSIRHSWTGPVMLIGPPGAGKTATAAKLATKARLSGRKCRLITMDTVKAGGLDQITTFATALESHSSIKPADAIALERLVSEAAGQKERHDHRHGGV